MQSDLVDEKCVQMLNGQLKERDTTTACEAQHGIKIYDKEGNVEHVY
jgi:hypothetical protein